MTCFTGQVPTVSLSVCYDQKRKEEHQPAQIILNLLLLQGLFLEFMGSGIKARTHLLCLTDDLGFIHSSADTKCKQESRLSLSLPPPCGAGKSVSFLLAQIYSLWLWAPSHENFPHLCHNVFSPMGRYWWKPRVTGSRGTHSLFNHSLPKSLEVAYPSLHPSSLVNGFSQWFPLQFFLRFWAASGVTTASPRQDETLWLRVVMTTGGTTWGGRCLSSGC